LNRGATCRQKARNLARPASGSLPRAPNSWKSRITVSFAVQRVGHDPVQCGPPAFLHAKSGAAPMWRKACRFHPDAVEPRVVDQPEVAGLEARLFGRRARSVVSQDVYPRPSRRFCKKASPLASAARAGSAKGWRATASRTKSTERRTPKPGRRWREYVIIMGNRTVELD